MIKKYALFRVFEYLRNTDQKESVRSLSRNAKVGVATAKRCLDYLFEKKIVKRDVIARLYQYKLDESNILTKQLKISMSIAEINESSMIEELTSSYPGVISITLYGSAANGTDNPKSDIDILIISQKDIKVKPLKSEKKLKKELSLIKYTYKEWKNKAESDKPFYDRVISEGIPVYGEIPMVK